MKFSNERVTFNFLLDKFDFENIYPTKSHKQIWEVYAIYYAIQCKRYSSQVSLTITTTLSEWAHIYSVRGEFDHTTEGL